MNRIKVEIVNVGLVEIETSEENINFLEDRAKEILDEILKLKSEKKSFK